MLLNFCTNSLANNLQRNTLKLPVCDQSKDFISNASYCVWGWISFAGLIGEIQMKSLKIPILYRNVRMILK